jgi:hypothetical protein
MNASVRLFLNQLRPRLLAGAGACALLGGCAGVIGEDVAVDPGAHLAPEMAKAAQRDDVYPTFASIPSAPKDIRPAAAFATAAADVTTARDQLDRETAPETWALNGTEAYAAGLRADLDDVAVPGAADSAATEAFARKLRERATPPPLTQ